MCIDDPAILNARLGLGTPRAIRAAVTSISAARQSLGVVLLISQAARLAHVGALLQRFGYEVRELAEVPAALTATDRQRCEVELVILDEAVCIGCEVDPVALLLGVLSLASILIVQRTTRALRREPSDRCGYLAPSFSPIDVTLAVIDLLERRQRRAN